LRFHRALVRRKYQWLFSSKTGRRPGPKGPSKELIAAILEIKRLNPRFGCPRIAQQISHAFGLDIDKDVVRRILANHPLPKSGGNGPSWLSAIAEARDSLWSVDLFRCESILLKSFCVMVVMDVCASLSSIHRAADRNPSARVARPDLLLERPRPASQAESIRRLLQPAARARRTQWSHVTRAIGTSAFQLANLQHFAWRSDCSGLFHTPITA
jgi:hypothetical protein